MSVTIESYKALAESSYYKFYGSHIEDVPKNIEGHNHIVQVASSVMMDRDGFCPGGGFVKAINANNLEETVARADATCIKHLQFFVYCKKFSHLNQY
jgi:hypothetical protein